MKISIQQLMVSGLAAAGVGLSAGASAGAYPDHAVRVIVPYSVGGGADIAARLISQKLSVILHQSFVVENRTGGGGMIGAGAAANSPADGYTLLLGDSSEMTISPPLYGNAQYDPVTSFDPIAVLGTSPSIVVANKAFEANTVSEFFKMVKASPDKYMFGSGGPETPPHLAVERFKILHKLQLPAVPYKGGGPMMTAVMGAQIPVGFTTTASAINFVKNGQVKALAVMSKQRTPLLPDVPSVAEQGLPDLEAATWYALLAPAGTPPAILQTLNDAIQVSLKDPAVRERLGTLGLDPGTPDQTGEAMRQRIKTETDAYRQVIKDANIKPF
ncbi:MAG TPA: tripartite tricarboxylate transporter substrate-binding protein [Bordetella sp.]|jgi:tripartite-type tricarboxylate transporter receptor subunit TctC|nr:tripartite tricarboxylate transporter substrate-binding protein [Bordetella sp.]